MTPSTDRLAQRLHQNLVLQVGILVFDEVEVLDFAGPFEVFSVAARISANTLGRKPMEVALVARNAEPVTARHGLRVLAERTMAEANDLDLLIVPGGVVTQVLREQPVLDWIGRMHQVTAATASVCTGAFLLAKLGLLDGLSATTHWEDIPDLRAAHPNVEVLENVPYVDHGRLITSAGISAGIGMSLHLVGRILGRDWALATARQMEYDWTP